MNRHFNDSFPLLYLYYTISKRVCQCIFYELLFFLKKYF
nr:MAG TPA: hypothetical protein [Caudoviricetes sp.]